MRLASLIRWPVDCRGWRATLLLFFAGVLTALAFAPFDCWPLLFLTFTLLLHHLEHATRGQVLRHLFFFGYGFFMAGTYWIANSLLVDADKFAWMIPLSVLGLSAGFALYLLPMGYLFARWRMQDTLSNLLLFALLWVATEYLRSLGMFGFPWNLMGYVVMSSERLMQSAAVLGPFGLSLPVVIIACAPLLWWRGHRQRHWVAVVLLALTTLAYGYGMWRMPEGAAALTETRLRIVQANIPQALKWTPQGKDESMRLHGVLTHMQTDAPLADIIIWPETAFPFLLNHESYWLPRLRHFAPQGGYLITGAVRDDPPGTLKRITNSLFVISAEGKVAAAYDKHQLVPFGEFVPLRAILPLEKITPSDLDFSRGAGAQTLAPAAIPPFSPLICYEVVFPWITVNKTTRPDWILNVTNDAWFGNSPGPYQHFAMARMRAVEQGLPLVRAANTGISAVIDPYGRILRALPLGARGVIDQALPKPLAPTVYAAWGEIPAFFLLTLLALFRWWHSTRSNRAAVSASPG
jgi:apolipoprotein N-acyltransferase